MSGRRRGFGVGVGGGVGVGVAQEMVGWEAGCVRR